MHRFWASGEDAGHATEGVASNSDLRPLGGLGRLVLRVSNWTRFRGPSSKRTENPIQSGRVRKQLKYICFPAVLETASRRVPRPRICSRKPLAEWFSARKPCWQGFPHSRPSPIGLSVPLLLGAHLSLDLELKLIQLSCLRQLH